MIYERMKNEKEYLHLHKKYQARGLKIPDGSIVEPTDWAYQNGVITQLQYKSRIFIKDGNCRNKFAIRIRKKGNQQSEQYWAGFWKIKKSNKL